MSSLFKKGVLNMTVKKLVELLDFEPICLPDENREVSGVYIGDLLSWVMGRAGQDNLWITIMSNINIVAVATLSDVACIILAEGVMLEDEVRALAMEKGVNIIKTELSAYDAALRLSSVLC